MNGSELVLQHRRAENFGYHLGCVWNRADGAPSALTILDALVLSGLRLSADTEGVATATLFTRKSQPERTAA